MIHVSDRPKSEWTERSKFWLDRTIKHGRSRNLRERQSKPIILTGDGVHLRVEKGTLHIQNGFTHCGQERETHRFFRGDLDLPSRIVAVDCSGGLSFDVLAWLAEQGVALICVDWKGDGVSAFACNGFAADRKKLAWQIATRANEAARLEFSIDLIARKLGRSIETLGAFIPSSTKRDAAIATATEGMARLEKHPPNDLAELRGIEGPAAGAYFAAWRGLPMRWKSTARYPIPDGWHRYKSRSSLANGLKAKNPERITSAERPVELWLWDVAASSSDSGRSGWLRPNPRHHASWQNERCVRVYLRYDGAGEAEDRCRHLAVSC